MHESPAKHTIHTPCADYYDTIQLLDCAGNPQRIRACVCVRACTAHAVLCVQNNAGERRERTTLSVPEWCGGGGLQ